MYRRGSWTGNLRQMITFPTTNDTGCQAETVVILRTMGSQVKRTYRTCEECSRTSPDDGCEDSSIILQKRDDKRTMKHGKIGFKQLLGNEVKTNRQEATRSDRKNSSG